MCCLEKEELPSMISSLILQMLPLQVDYANSLPVQQAARCQVRKQKHIQAKIKRENFEFPILEVFTFICYILLCIVLGARSRGEEILTARNIIYFRKVY